MNSKPPLHPFAASLLTAALLVALALFLDSYGIAWGLPSTRHIESFHPDEWTVIEAARRVNPLAGQLNPGFYNYGSLYIYALWFAFSITGMGDGTVALDPAGKAALYLTARSVTVLFSVGVVLLTWRLGRRLFGPRVGVLGAILLAVTPLFAVYSHYAIVDVPATFWMVASVLAASYAVPASQRRPLVQPTAVDTRRQGSLSLPLLLSAAAAGLAAGTKYNAGIALLAPLLAYFWRPGKAPDARRRAGVERLHAWGDRLYGCLVLAAVAVVCFLISTPGFLTDRAQFIRDFSFEVWHVRTGHDYIFTNTAPAFIHHLTRSLPLGMGPPLCVTALAGVLWAIFRRTRADALLAVVALTYYLVIGLAQVKFMRYTIPLLPFLCVWTARLLVDALSTYGQASASSTIRSRALRLAAVLCLIIPALFAFLDTLAYDRVLAGQDVRLRALDWVDRHVPAHSSVGMIRHPWFSDPPLIPYNSIRATDEWILAHQDRWRYQMEFTGWSSAMLEKELPDYFLLSDWAIRYRLRLHHLDPEGTSDAAKAGREAWKLVATLHRSYNLAAPFSAPAKLGPMVFSQVLPPPGQDIGVDGDSLGRAAWAPDDWLFPNPTLWIYVRKGLRPG